MWIETVDHFVCGIPKHTNSFASNGECGLKLAWYLQRGYFSRNSFASNGECGLKQQMGAPAGCCTAQFIRQQWRMWIETRPARRKHQLQPSNSFASNGECGLKHSEAAGSCERAGEFIRQQWRMWIETRVSGTASSALCRNSFASNGECGLKRQCCRYLRRCCRIHSPAMANVD